MSDREYKRFAGQSVNNAGYHNHNWDLFHNGTELRDVSYPSLAAAIKAIGSAEKTLYITTQHRITSNTTIPSNISIVVPKGGSFDRSAGAILTIEGSFEAGDYTVFTGLGSTVFSKEPDPENVLAWFGAAGGGVANDSAAAIAAIAALPAGSTLKYKGGRTYIHRGIIPVSKALEIKAYGATVWFDTNANNQGFEATASRFRWKGGIIKGPQHATLDESQKGIYVHGSSSAAYLSGIEIHDVKIHNWGGHAIYQQFVEDFDYWNYESYDCFYSGLTQLSSQYGRNAEIYIHDIHANGALTDGYGYGMIISKSSGTDAAQPQSHHVTNTGIIIKNVPNWEAFDMHGGHHVTLDNFNFEGCRFGVALGSFIQLSGSFSAASYCVVSNGTIKNDPTTQVSRANLGMGVVFNGRRDASVPGDRVRGIGNKLSNVVIDGYAPYAPADNIGGAGGSGNAVTGTTGSIELQYQDGSTVDNVTILNSGVIGIRWISSINCKIHGAYIKTLNGDAWVKSSGGFAFAGNPTDGDTVTINTRVYTFRAAAAIDGEITIGANLAATLTAAVAQINADTDGRVSTCSYTAGATSLTVTAKYASKSFNAAYFPLAASVATVTDMTGGTNNQGAVGVYLRTLNGSGSVNTGEINGCAFDVGENICISGANEDHAGVTFAGNKNLNPTTSVLYSIPGSGSGGANNGCGDIQGFDAMQYRQTIPSLSCGDAYTFYAPSPSCPSPSFGVCIPQLFQDTGGARIEAVPNNNYIAICVRNLSLFAVTLGTDRRFSAFVDQIISPQAVTGLNTYTISTNSAFALPGDLDLASGKVLKVSGTQVITSQQTGMGANLGAATAGAAYTAAEQAMLQAVYDKMVAMETKLKAHGLIAT